MPEKQPANPNLPIMLASQDLRIVDIEAAAAANRPPRFEMTAYTGGTMRLTGYDLPVCVDLSGLELPSQGVTPIRLQHDAKAGVGHADKVYAEAGQLKASGIISRDTEAAREVIASAKRGFPWQASIGAVPSSFEYLADNGQCTVNGQTIVGPCYIARKARLNEISFVDLGADQGGTGVNIEAKSAEPQGAAHMPKTTETNPTTTVTQPANTPPATPPIEAGAPTGSPAGDIIQAMRQQASAEATRIAAVQGVAKEYPEICAQAINEGWDVTKTELAVLRKRPQAPAIQAHSSTAPTAEVIEAAACMAGKLDGIEKQFGAQTLEAAAKLSRHGFGLGDILASCAVANGYHGSFRDHREVLRYAFAIQAGTSNMSAINTPGIFSNTANKFLLAGYNNVENVWRQCFKTRPVNDFKSITSYRLSVGAKYKKIAPGGELEHGKMGEESYTNKADSYGLILAIGRVEIINDDLSALTDAPKQLGRGGALTINEIVWAEFMNNAAKFSTDAKNYKEGADTALSLDSLGVAEQMFMDQVDKNGDPLGWDMARLLVPTSLNSLANTIYTAKEIRNTTGKSTTENPHQGKFKPICSRYLGNAKFTGASQKAWYGLADPNQATTVEVVFLNGREEPTIETAQADFSVLGIQMRAYHDFGASWQDPRAAVKMKGEA
jgi:hypothetical protein